MWRPRGLVQLMISLGPHHPRIPCTTSLLTGCNLVAKSKDTLKRHLVAIQAASLIIRSFQKHISIFFGPVVSFATSIFTRGTQPSAQARESFENPTLLYPQTLVAPIASRVSWRI